jgi:hypothetical protein
MDIPWARILSGLFLSYIIFLSGWVAITDYAITDLLCMFFNDSQTVTIVNTGPNQTTIAHAER